MYNMPQGFIDKAIGDVRKAFFFDRNQGMYHPAEHYFILGTESVWNSYLFWKNQDSGRDGHSLLYIKDIEYGCRNYGIPCFNDNDDLLVQMKNMSYRFIPSWIFCYGGPVGSDMKYLTDVTSAVEMRFSIGAMFRLLKWFDKAIPKVREQIDTAVDVFGRQFKRAQILQAGAEQILEPGLEDVPYRYSFRSDDADRLDIWVYYDYFDDGSFGDFVRLSFRYEEYTRNPQFIKNAVKRLAQDKDNIESYMMWATNPIKNKESFPVYSKIKNAGLFALYEKNE